MHTKSTSRLVELPDEPATLAYAATLARALTPGLLIYLKGQLGAGKTTFVRGVLRELGHSGAVKSPTYTIVEPYLINGQAINHFDLYRLSDVEELELLGFRDYVGGSAICFIEWPERGAGFLPVCDLEIDLSLKSGSNSAARLLRVCAYSDAGSAVLNNCLV